jgi:FLYWCH zinc finger domain
LTKEYHRKSAKTVAPRKSAQFFKMSLKVRIVITSRGSEQLIDANDYKYYFNKKSKSAKYWLSSQTGCNVRLMTDITTNSLVGEELPVHNQGTNLNKRQAMAVQHDTI